MNTPARSAGRWLVSALLLASAMAAGGVYAEGGLLLVDAPPAHVATQSAGVTLFAMPAYPGGGGTRFLLIPAYEWRHPDGAFASTDLGLGWNLSHRADLQLGVRLWPIFARHAGDGARLAGQPAVPGGIERTAFLTWTPVPYAQLQSSLRTGFGADQRGVLTEVGGSIGAPLGRQVLAGVTIGMSYANAAYRRAYFSATPAMAGAAAASGSSAASLPAAGGGWQDLQLALGAEWAPARHWRVDGRLERWRLLGAAAASPLTESRWQTAGVLSLWYDFSPAD